LLAQLGACLLLLFGLSVIQRRWQTALQDVLLRLARDRQAAR
jgi:hypothetical protein